MKIKSIGLAWLSSANIVRSREFFSSVLGLTLVTDAPEYGWLELQAEPGAFMLGVGAANGHNPVQPGNNAVITLSVDDIEAAKDFLEKRGVQFISAIEEVPGHVKLALFLDPDGNKLQLVQSLDGK